jgi:predicted nicotinamide N-methyase
MKSILTPATAEAFILANTALMRRRMCRRSCCGWPTNRIRSLAEDRGGTGRDRPAAAVLGLCLGRRSGAGALCARHPETVRGKRVLDFATGSGAGRIAAAKAGATQRDRRRHRPVLRRRDRLNAAPTASALTSLAADLIGATMAGTSCWPATSSTRSRFADRLDPWFEALAARGATVLVGDPGRAYPAQGDRLSERLPIYQVPVTRALEDAEVKALFLRSGIWRRKMFITCQSFLAPIRQSLSQSPAGMPSYDCVRRMGLLQHPGAESGYARIVGMPF